MSNTTLTDIDELMAVEVMGLEPHEDISGGKDLYYLNPKTKVMYVRSKVGSFPIWNPTTDMDQAMGCVQKFGRPFTLECIGDYRATIDDLPQPHEAIDKNPALAICKAILKAKGSKYE